MYSPTDQRAHRFDLKLLAIFALFVMMCPAFFSSSVFHSSAATKAASATATTLTLGELGTPPLPALNPFNPVSDYTLLGMEYDFMFSLNWPPLPEITPVMAGGFSSNANGSQWIISVRPNLKWDNGSPLNSTDLNYTLSVYNETGDFSPIISNMTILNSTAVQVNLAGPNLAFILTGFIDNGIAVLPAQTFASIPFANLSTFQNLNNIVADGPYVFSNYTGQENPIPLTPNPYYWNGPPKLEGVNYEYYSSLSSEFNAFIGGQIGALFYPGAYNGLQAVANITGSTLLGPPYATPALTVAALLNDWVYPTNITDFRRALAFATNTTLINDELNGPYANQSVSNQDFLLPSYNEAIGFSNGTGPVGFSYNVTEAKQLMLAAGLQYSGNTLEYQNGTAVSLTIKFRYPTDPYSQDVATLLATQWQQLGMTVNEVNVPSSTLRAGANNPAGWQVIATGVLGPQTDNGVTPGPGILQDIGDYYVNINGTHTSWNSTFYSLIQNMSNEQPNSTQFNANAQAAATLYTEGVPEIPLFNVFNWVPVSNNYYWGSPQNNTGIYYTQAITGEIFWGLSLDAVAPASATSSSSTSSTTSSSSSSATSSSSMVSSTSSSSSSSSTTITLPIVTTTSIPTSTTSGIVIGVTSTTSSSSSTVEYAGVAIVIVIIIVVAALVMMRRRPSGAATTATTNP
jgi:peptide/nickel transport system substrate-binding protein